MLKNVSSEELEKIIKIVKDGGGEVFEKEGYINFCGVRNNKTNDTFNDTLYVYWKYYDEEEEEFKFKGYKIDEFTTKPGKDAVLNLNKDVNEKGVAILKEGWHKNIWKIGRYKGKNEYDAFVQTGWATITRDNTQQKRRDGKYELKIISNTKEIGKKFCINLHKSASPLSTRVGNWSHGSQVFQYESDFNQILSKSKTSEMHGQNTFSYFLTNKTIFDSLSKSEEDNNENKESESEEVEYTQQEQQEDVFNEQQEQQKDVFNDKSNSTQSGSNYSNNVSNLGSVGKDSNFENHSNKSNNQSTNKSNNQYTNKSNNQSKNREKLLNALIKGSPMPNEVKKCLELILTCNKKGVK
jgi:hypothetical protein